MSEVINHDLLVHKLSYHRDMISDILDMPCASSAHLKLAAIERKIVAMEELVLELPYDDETTSFEEWRLSISELYRKLFQLASERKKKPEKAVSSEKTAKENSTQKDVAGTNSEVEIGNVSTATTGAVTSTGAGGNGKANKKSQSNASAERGNDGKALKASRRPGPVKQTYRNLSFRRTSGAVPSEPVIEKSAEEFKEDLKSQYEGFFAKLEPVAELTVDSNLEAMRIFAFIVNRCIRQMTPFEEDSQLMSDVLNYALAKAPKSVIERYNTLSKEADLPEEKDSENDEESKRPPLKGLRLLKNCLIAELTSYYEASKAAIVTEEGDCGAEAADSHNCYYCKSNGHYKSRCPQVKNQICFRCFKRGHRAKECSRRCFKCGLNGHLKKFCKMA